MGRDSLLGWWLRELADLFRRNDGASGEWSALIQRDGDGFIVHQRQRNGIEARRIDPGAGTRISAPSRQVVLRLRPQDVVRRSISLPRGERRDLEAIIRNQLEFLAPWPADKVLFDYEMQEAGSSADRLVPVVVTMTGKDLVDDLLQKLQASGIKVGVIDAGDQIESRPTINLLRAGEADDALPPKALRIGLGLLVATAVAVAAVGGYFLFGHYRELGRIESSMQAVRAAADEAQRLSKSAADLKAKSERLANRKLADPAAMLVLEALSRSLPDDTWLTNVEVRGRDVRILGKSPNAASLIGVLEGSKAFTKVRFAAPTTREAGQDIDTFSIVAEAGKVMEVVK